MKKLTDKIHNAFDNIKADVTLKESTKQFVLTKRRNKVSLFSYLAFQKTFPIAICIALVFVVGIGGYSWIQAPVSYISIDVNPSIELALNRFDRVVSATAYNQEGKDILKNLSLNGKIYTIAIDEIVENQTMNTYLTEESEIIFTIATNHSHESDINTGVQRCCGHTGHNSQSISADTSIVEEAHNNGLSLGKYYAYLQLAQYDDTITIDEFKEMSMAEIYGLTCGHEHNNNINSDENNTDDDCCASKHSGCHHTH